TRCLSGSHDGNWTGRDIAVARSMSVRNGDELTALSSVACCNCPTDDTNTPVTYSVTPATTPPITAAATTPPCPVNNPATAIRIPRTTPMIFTVVPTATIVRATRYASL